MWPFTCRATQQRRKDEAAQDKEIRQRQQRIIDAHPVGSTIYYLGTEMRVTGHSQWSRGSRYFPYIYPETRCVYLDKSGKLRTVSLSPDEMESCLDSAQPKAGLQSA